MKLTKKSQLLLSFFMNNVCTNHLQNSKKNENILKLLYHDIITSYKYLNTIKQVKGSEFYNIHIKKIININQISKPNNFNSKSFPYLVRTHIDDMSMSEISYTFSLFNRNIKLIFITEEEDIESKIVTYNEYVDSMIIWIYILNEYSSKSCSKNLTIYLYFTSLEKKLPKSHIEILNEIHINTAFTTTCPKDSEIVVFRKEEWFKVFIHETFHNFALDFSDMENTECNNHILSIFKVQSHVNIYESYTEFWAEIINSLFCSFFTLTNKENVDEFLILSEKFINYERCYSFFQLIKTLDFMGLQYKDLYSNTKKSELLRNTMYKEETNVLAYYVIKTIMMNNYQGFLSWCENNNDPLLQFKKTISNQNSFCYFIEKNYKTNTMLENIKNTELLLEKIKNIKRKDRKLDFLTTNMRMTMCELG